MKITLSSLFLIVSAILVRIPSQPATAISAPSAAQDASSPAERSKAPGEILTEDQKPGAQPVTEKQKITTFLWFDHDAEDAVHHYTSIFKDARILSETRWGEGGPVPKGTLMTAEFQLAGQEFIALNGGSQSQFNEAISLLVRCENQTEVDELWEKLGAGGEPGQCGWLKDRYGLSWQIVPTALLKMLQDQDPAKVRRVTDVMLQMRKLDIRRLQQAYDGR